MRGSSLADFMLLLLPASALRHGCTSSCLPPTGVAAGRCVCTRMCVFLCARDGGGSFCRCNSSSQRFPTMLFSTDVPLCSCVSSHVVISAPFWRCGPTTQQYFPHKACQSLFSFQDWGFCSSEWVSMSPCFRFRLFMSMPRSLVYPRGQTDDGLKWTRCFLVVMSRPIWISYISSSFSVASRGSKQLLLTCTKRATGFWLHLWRLSGLTLCRGVVHFVQTDVQVPETMC